MAEDDVSNENHDMSSGSGNTITECRGQEQNGHGQKQAPTAPPQKRPRNNAPTRYPGDHTPRDQLPEQLRECKKGTKVHWELFRDRSQKGHGIRFCGHYPGDENCTTDNCPVQERLTFYEMNLLYGSYNKFEYAITGVPGYTPVLNEDGSFPDEVLTPAGNLIDPDTNKAKLSKFRGKFLTDNRSMNRKRKRDESGSKSNNEQELLRLRNNRTVWKQKVKKANQLFNNFLDSEHGNGANAAEEISTLLGCTVAAAGNLLCDMKYNNGRAHFEYLDQGDEFAFGNDSDDEPTENENNNAE